MSLDNVDKICPLDRRVSVIVGTDDQKKSIGTVSQLRDLDHYVLLGEPGIGKSTSFGLEALFEGAAVCSVRDAITDEPVQQKTLFLDGLDEYRADGQPGEKTRTLAKVVKASGAARWRLSCRSEDWRKEADIAAVQTTTAGRPIVVAQILSLDYSEAKQILSVIDNPDPSGFLDKAYALGAHAFTENPMSLRLLNKAVQADGNWPKTRFEVFEKATRTLAYERNSEHKFSRTRPRVDALLDAAGEICLRLLTTGVEHVWRSGDEPPQPTDKKYCLNSDELQLDTQILSEVLDTPLFRGEGELFTPAHRTVAEFLAARALAQRVAGLKGNAMPLGRAIALIGGADGAPPTELRGLFGWFAAHLGIVGETAAIEKLIRSDPMTVLAYGDAAALDTQSRRQILRTIGDVDPYFRVSSVGVTAIGGLSGEDLVDDFERILRSTGEESHRKYTVLEVLTVGQPVPSIAPVLRDLIVDPSQAEWVRSRALEALLNCADNVSICLKGVFEEVKTQQPSLARAVILTEVASHLWPVNLSREELKAVLRDFEDRPDDNTVGRLRGLQNSVTAAPDLRVFDQPVELWRATQSGNYQVHEVDDLLDASLAAGILGTSGLSAQGIVVVVRNARRYRWAAVGKETIKAIQQWLSGAAERALELYNVIRGSQDEDAKPWSAPNEYRVITQTDPAVTVLSQFFELAKSEVDPSTRAVLLNEVVDLAKRPTADAGVYWSVYSWIATHCEADLLEAISAEPIPEYKHQEYQHLIESRQRQLEERQRVLSILEPQIEILAAGAEAHNLNWFAEQYFAESRSGDASSIERIIAETSPEIVAACVTGCSFAAINLPVELTPKKLGELEAKSSRYYIEVAAVAGLDLMLQRGRLPPLQEVPIELALVVLKNSFVISDKSQREVLEAWAAERLLLTPDDGITALTAFWSAILKKGYNQLKGINSLKCAAGIRPVLEPAIKKILSSFNTAPGDVLRSTIFAGLELLQREELALFAETALSNSKIVGEGRRIWLLIAFLLNPARWENAFLEAYSSESKKALLDDYFSSEMRTRLVGTSGRDRAIRDAAFVRLLAPVLEPNTDRDYRSEGIRLRNALDGLGENLSPEAGECLLTFKGSIVYAKWHSYVQHAMARRQRILRDSQFVHPSPAQVNSALDNRDPINSVDLIAIVLDELEKLRTEIRTGPNSSWKRFWNLDGGEPTDPLIENQGRDYLLDRLSDRLKRYGIKIAIPEARRADETRSDVLIVTGAGNNLPIEVKRHFHKDVWTAASTQLQGYALAPDASGLGILLVFWYGTWQKPPKRPNGGPSPTSANEMQAMLEGDLPASLQTTTSIVVIDVSDSDPVRTAQRAAKKKARTVAKSRPASRAKSRSKAAN